MAGAFSRGWWLYFCCGLLLCGPALLLGRGPFLPVCHWLWNSSVGDVVAARRTDLSHLSQGSPHPLIVFGSYLPEPRLSTAQLFLASQGSVAVDARPKSGVGRDDARRDVASRSKQ